MCLIFETAQFSLNRCSAWIAFVPLARLTRCSHYGGCRRTQRGRGDLKPPSVLYIWYNMMPSLHLSPPSPVRVHLQETQARAMTCAACSTYVCVPLPPKRQPFTLNMSSITATQTFCSSFFHLFFCFFPLTVTMKHISFCLAQC